MRYGAWKKRHFLLYLVFIQVFDNFENNRDNVNFLKCSKMVKVGRTTTEHDFQAGEGYLHKSGDFKHVLRSTP
jgi:hypothetical protein